MHTAVEITLFTFGVEPKTFTAQTIEIEHDPDTISQGVDGRVTSGSHPSTIHWLGGTKGNLEHATGVRIVDSRGAVLIDGELNTHYGVPRDEDGWMVFDVLKRA